MKKLMIVGLAGLLCQVSFAVPRANKFMLSPSIIYYRYANKRQIQSDVMPGLAVDYGLTDRWSVQISLSNISTKYKTGDKRKVSGWMSFLDGIYYFQPDSYFQPYLLGGLGVTNLRPRMNADPSVETSLNAGAGVAYFVDSRIGLRTDVRDVYTPNGGKNDLMLNFGVSFLFDGPVAKKD